VKAAAALGPERSLLQTDSQTDGPSIVGETFELISRDDGTADLSKMRRLVAAADHARACVYCRQRIDRLLKSAGF